MKNLILILAILFSLNTNAQIKVEDTPKYDRIYQHKMGFHAIYKAIDSTSIHEYILIFRDCQYQQIVEYKTIKFSSKQDVIDFFNLVKSVIETKESKTLKFSDQTIDIISVSKNAKVFLGEGFCWFSTKWVQKCLDSL